MRDNDQQLGKPMRVYRDTKANIEALGLGAADEGCEAYATDTEDFGTFDGASWAWYPAKNQAETITGVWIFDHLKKAMEIRNADEYVTGPDPTGIVGAHADLPARGGIILLGPRQIDFGNAINITKPCFLQCAGRGIISLNPNAEPGASTELRWTGAIDAPYMIRFKAPNVNEYYFGGGFERVCLNGNDKASVGALLSSTVHTRVLDIHGRGCKVAQVKVDGGNGVLSAHNYFDNIHITTGANPATAAAHGLMFDGSVDTPTTENFIGKISGLVQNGYLVWMKECDHCVANQLHGSPTGTGGALWLDGTVGSLATCNTFHFVSGDVAAKAGSYGNKILHLSNEGLDFAKLESGADIFYILTDYGIGKQWFSTHNQLFDSQSLSPGSFISVVGAPSTALWAAQWGVWLLDAGITEGIAANFRIPARWRYGRIAFHITWGIPVNAAGNVVWRVVAERGTVGSNVAVPDYVQTVTDAVPANNVTLERSVTPGYMNVNAGDEILIRVERLGGAGGDTYGSDAAFISLHVRFYGRLPVNGDETIGPFYAG